MAFNSILRKSNSFVRAFACAGQLIRKTQPGHHTVLFAAVNRYEDSLVPRFHFSSVAVKNKPTSDENLLRGIESEIKYAEDLIDVLVEEVPGNFPFKIVDSPGQQTITLERTYEGDEIKVEVHMPDLVTGKQHGDDKDDRSERASQSSIPLSVSVSKKGGPSLEFSCVGYPDGIFIDSLSVKNPDLADDQIPYEGPDFQDLDESLQKTFHEYLEIRGIKPSTTKTFHECLEIRGIKPSITNFSHEYIVNKVEEVPGNFPFKIVDSPGQQTIMLERTYQGEEIKVEVHMPDLVTKEFEVEAYDDDKDDRSERASQSSIPLSVSVSKKVGPSLEFSCVGYPDEIFIDSLSVKNPDLADDQIPYEGPDFQDLDESSQKACHAYLESIGIKPTTTNFLHEYMINKDSREYLVWLKKLKNFIQA